MPSCVSLYTGSAIKTRFIDVTVFPAASNEKIHTRTVRYVTYGRFHFQFNGAQLYWFLAIKSAPL